MQTFGSSARPPAGSPQGNATWSADLVVASGSLVHGRDGKLQGLSGPAVPLHKPPPLMAPAFGMAVGQTTLVRTGEGNKTALIMVAHGYDWLPPIGRGVNKTTVYALRSDDNGASFRFLSRVPCLLTPGTNMSRWCSQNIGGPAEPALTQLADGRLLLLFRTTGTPLMKALSSDLGLTWTDPELTPMWSVWPQIRLLPNGVLVVSSGRPSIGVWWCGDGVGDTWVFQNLAAMHNELLPSQPQWHYGPLQVACDRMPCLTVRERSSNALLFLVPFVCETVTVLTVLDPWRALRCGNNELHWNGGG